MFSSHFDMTCNSYEDDISYNNNKEDLDDNKENEATWLTVTKKLKMNGQDS